VSKPSYSKLRPPRKPHFLLICTSLGLYPSESPTRLPCLLYSRVTASFQLKSQSYCRCNPLLPNQCQLLQLFGATPINGSHDCVVSPCAATLARKIAARNAPCCSRPKETCLSTEDPDWVPYMQVCTHFDIAPIRPLHRLFLGSCCDWMASY
jgi:hypothetical protein